jgi:hypothetical protein
MSPNTVETFGIDAARRTRCRQFASYGTLLGNSRLFGICKGFLEAMYNLLGQFQWDWTISSGAGYAAVPMAVQRSQF